MEARVIIIIAAVVVTMGIACWASYQSGVILGEHSEGARIMSERLGG